MPLAAVAFVVATLVQAGVFGSVAPLRAHAAGPSAAGGDLERGLVAPVDHRAGTASVVFEPSGRHDPAVMASRWVAPHQDTRIWNGPGPNAEALVVAYRWAPLQLVGAGEFGRLPVWDPASRQRGWVTARDVGPVDPAYIGTGLLPPIGRPVAWGGPARVTMYTCVELGGCAPTASGLWPEPGMVAVDPTVIPLGSTVWIQGLGTFLAADTGSLVRGAHLDVYGLSYQEAIAWGVQERSVLVFPPTR